MATCPNKNLQSWKDLVSSKGENLAYYLWDKYKGEVPVSEYKPGIQELFDSNPELANAVYEALGFKKKNIEDYQDVVDKQTYQYLDRIQQLEDWKTEPQPINVKNLDTYIKKITLGTQKGKYEVNVYENGKEVNKYFNTQEEAINEALEYSNYYARQYNNILFKSAEDRNSYLDQEIQKVVDKATENEDFRQYYAKILGSEITPQQKQQAQQLYSQYLDTKQPDVILPIGTSGSGKSTFIKSLPQENLVVIEPDAMRVEFTGDMNNKSKDKEIYVEAATRAIQAIKQGKQVVFDTTNLTKDKRLPFIEAIKKEIPTANIQYKLMELNPELAKQRIKAQLERGENRAAVSDETIDRHAASYKQMLEDIKNEPITEYKELGSKQDIEGFKEFVGKEEKIPTLTEKAEKVAKPKKDIIFTPFNDLENLPKGKPC